MITMSPCAVSQPQHSCNLPGSLLLAQFGVQALDAESLGLVKGGRQPAGGLSSLPAAVSEPGWCGPLRALAGVPELSYGTAAELAGYAAFVGARIAEALAAGRACREWSSCGLLERLEKAAALVAANRTSAGRAMAVESLGFASLAGHLASCGERRGAGAGGWRGSERPVIRGAQCGACGAPASAQRRHDTIPLGSARGRRRCLAGAAQLQNALAAKG